MIEKINYESIERCPVTATMEIIGGKWKILILYLISNEINRFGKMSLMLRTISKQMLTSQLRELEEDGLIERKIYAEIPPRVEYYLTSKGHSLLPVITVMKDWGLQYLKEQQTAVPAAE
jgi:DNA-binding HxlR family transcriptional regulator